MHPKNIYFRAGVGMIIRNKDHVAFFERADQPGHWQFPQGGMYQGESPEDAMYRELQEETGLTSEHMEEVHEVPFLVSYTYPRAVMDSLNATGANYIGQTQRWFILTLKEGAKIDLSLASDRELTDIKWIDPQQALEEIIDFKQGEYKQLIEYYQKQILK